jgi:acetyl-CoA carboxylase carboxyltransferase component
MNSKHIGADMEFAWPDVEISTMEADMAAKIMYADEKDVKVIDEKGEEYASIQGASESAAKRGYVDAIIAPEATRKNLIYALEMLFTKKEDRFSKKHGTL